jgi:hypothetical protein
LELEEGTDMAAEAAGPAGAVLQALDALKELVTPEMIRALSPTEGFEAKPHTFQAVETEGRWKKAADFGQGRALEPPTTKSLSPGKLDPAKPNRATVLSNKIGGIKPDIVSALIRTILDTISPQTQLATTVLPNMTPTLPPAVAKAFPQLNSVFEALSAPSTVAEIEAVWWSDNLEIWSGQAAARHVNGFNSLFGHQARVELDGVSFGNYFPLSYCLTFTGYVNPVGPVFEEFRGAVRLGADGKASGLFCERSNRDKKKPDVVSQFDTQNGYQLKY